MEREKIEKIFNEVKNKNIGKKYFKHCLSGAKKVSSENIEFVKTITGMDKNYGSEGVYKKCVFFGDNKQYAILKHKDKFYKPSKKQFRKNDDIIKFNDWLISKGVRTPKIYSIFFADAKYFEINERIKGQAMYLNDVNVVSHALGKMPYDKMTDILSEEVTGYKKKKIGRNLYTHNMTSQSIMLHFDQSKYDDLFKQYIFLRNIGFSNFDIHPGNIMVNKDGFNIIDLNIGDELEDIKDNLEKVDNRYYTVDQIIEKLEKDKCVPLECIDKSIDIAEEFIETFSASLDYDQFLRNKYKDDIIANNIEIIRKAVKAVSKFGYKIEESKKLKEALGNNQAIISSIMSPQRKL